jgi:hypothetical protein
MEASLILIAALVCVSLAVLRWAHRTVRFWRAWARVPGPPSISWIGGHAQLLMDAKGVFEAAK